MLLVKKKVEGSNASSRPTGLFIDQKMAGPAPLDNSSDVIDMPPNARVEPQLENVEGNAFLKVKKTAALPAVSEAEVSSSKGSLRERLAKGLQSLRASTPKIKASAAIASEENATVSADLPPLKAANGSKINKAAKEVKEATVRKSPKATKTVRKDGSITIVAELDTGRQLFWQLKNDRFTQITAVTDDQVYSFSKEDLRFKSEGVLSYKQANDLALQEVGEAVQIINRSKDLGTVYASRQDRIMDAASLMIPAQQALDKLLVDNKKLGQALICGFLFKDAVDDSSLAVLYHIGIDGEASKPQISVNPDSMEFVIAQFSASRKIDKNATEVLLFGNAEFISALGSVVAYPNEPVWRGVTVRKLLQGTAVVAMAGAALSASWATLQFQQKYSLEQTQKQLKSEVTQVQNQINSAIQSHLPDFATAMSLDVPQLAAQAQDFWIPDARLVLTANLGEAKYELWMPVARLATFNNRPSAVNPITLDDHKKLVDFKAPEGCHRDGLGIAGGMNETEINITCQTGNPALNRYRID